MASTVLVYSYLEMHQEVIKTIETNLNESKRPYILSIKAIAYYHLGKNNRSRDLIKEIESSHQSGDSSYFSLAMIYAQMLSIDAAFEWLQNAYMNHEVNMFRLNVIDNSN